MHVGMPTPTEAAAIEQNRAFRARIAEAAERLAESKRPAPKPVSVNPEAMPAETDPPLPEFRLVYAFQIGPTLPAVPTRPTFPTVDSIQRAAAVHYGVTVHDMKSARRTLDIVLPRQVAIYLCRCLTPHSLPLIGRLFGGRDHTTAIHSFHKIAGLVRSDATVALAVAYLIQELGGEPT